MIETCKSCGRSILPKWTTGRVNLALEMRDSGKTYEEIAETLGTTKNAIAGLLHREGKRCQP